MEPKKTYYTLKICTQSQRLITLKGYTQSANFKLKKVENIILA